jgi:flagellar motor switch protein FliN/FliY
MTESRSRQDQLAGAAEAAAAAYPAQTPLSAAPEQMPLGTAATWAGAGFIGSVSADLVLGVLDDAALAAAAGVPAGTVAPRDVLHGTLEAAVSGFGTGVLGESYLADPALFMASADTSTYALRDAFGNIVAWFGISVSQAAPAAAPNTPAATDFPVDVAAGLNRISSVEMQLTVEIGRTRMSVRDVLNLEPGKIVELDRSAGAPADVLLNGRKIAHGEVVVVDQDYAIRITRILDSAEDHS